MGFWNFLFNRWTILVIGGLFMCAGLMPEWTMAVVRAFGKMGWAEQRIGRGGTFSIWKLIGVLAPIAALIYFFTPGIQIHFDSNNTEETSTYGSEYIY